MIVCPYCLERHETINLGPISVAACKPEEASA